MSWRKNRTVTYLLVPVVVGVWTWIGFEVFNGLSQTRSTKTSSFNSGNGEEVLNQDWELPKGRIIDPFKIQRHSPVQRANTNQASSAQAVHSPSSASVVRWPTIYYVGEMSRESEVTVILSINGIVNPHSVGSTDGDISVLQCHSDSVLLKYLDEEKWYQLSEYEEGR